MKKMEKSETDYGEMVVNRLAWAVLIWMGMSVLVMLPESAFAYPGEQWRNRDASQILLKHNAYSEGLQWATDSTGDQYCYPIIQRKQGRAMKKFKPGRWFTEFISNDMVVDWIKRRMGDLPTGRNPCLESGVKAGKQPRSRADDRHTTESRILGEELTEPTTSCPDCYRNEGVICHFAHKAERDIRLTISDDPTHPDHGITDVAQACRDAGSN